MTEVVFIHGILGKPDFFDFLRPCIPADGFHTVDILLEGHCATPQDFARASMARWRGQVDATVQRLRADGRRIVIAAHSMGTLFAEIRRTRAIMAHLAVTTLAFLSARDEIVSPRSGRRFPLRPDITVATLPDSGHYYYPEPDRSRLTAAFRRLLEV